jgi:hypothetical protein
VRDLRGLGERMRDLRGLGERMRREGRLLTEQYTIPLLQSYAEGLRANMPFVAAAAEEMVRVQREALRGLRIHRAARRMAWAALPCYRRMWVRRP